MSAYGLRIFLMIGLFGLVSGALAQDRRLREAELDGLKTWYPLARPLPSVRSGVRGPYQPAGGFTAIDPTYQRTAAENELE